MAFTTSSILDYVSTVETKTLEALLDNAYTGTVGIAGGKCLYGRTVGTPGTCGASDTYHCTGYGSPQAIYYMCRRQTGTLKQRSLQWMANWTKHWGEQFVKFMINHDHPGGEKSKHGPCHPDQPVDLDAQRHVDAFGHMQVLCDPNMKARGGWSTAEAINWAALYYKWLTESFDPTNSREYIRYGYKMSGLAGCYDVAKYYGYNEIADDIMGKAIGFVLWAYRDDWRYEYAGNGTDSFYIWNYGPLLDDGSRQFKGYGDTEWTSQPWYDFHQIIGAYQLAIRILDYNLNDQNSNVDDIDATTFTTTNQTDNGTGLEAFYKLVEFVDHQSKWYSYEHRQFAPRGDYSTNDGDGFVNAKLHGFKFGTDTFATITTTNDVGLMTIADWNGLDDSTVYHRPTAIRAHESDGGYQVLRYTHTTLTIEKWRQHHPRRGLLWEPNATTGTTYLEPQFQRGASGNCHGIADIQYIRSMLYGDQDEKDLSFITMFDGIMRANSSDPTASKGQRTTLENIGLSPPASGMTYGRQWHWAVQIGHIIRNREIGRGDTD